MKTRYRYPAGTLSLAMVRSFRFYTLSALLEECQYIRTYSRMQLAFGSTCPKADQFDRHMQLSLHYSSIDSRVGFHKDGIFIRKR